MNRNGPRAFLEDLFNTAVAAAHPSTCLPAHLPAPPANGRLILLAAGKAAGSMTEVAERHYLAAGALDPGRIDGIAVTRHGYGRPTRVVPVVEALVAGLRQTLRQAFDELAPDLLGRVHAGV